MKNFIALVGLLAVVAAIPVPESQPQSSLDLLQIPFGNNKVSTRSYVLIAEFNSNWGSG